MDMAPKDSDESLMIEFREGNAMAFQELCQRYQNGVFHYFLRFLGNRQAAEEATQEVFFNVIRAANRYEPKAKFSTWIYRIAHNYGVDCYRRNKIRKMASLDQPHSANSTSTLLDTIVDQNTNTEEETMDKEIHDTLTQALDALNPDQREVFLMRENMGLSFQEIAKVLGVSTNTAKSRMRYALASLKKMLQHKLQPLKQVAGS
jgi:RNA polymerase sigma-70 factor (ECF subfamily)